MHIVVRWIGDTSNPGNTMHRLHFHEMKEEKDEVAHVRAAAAELRTNHQHRPEHYNIDTDIGVAAVADDNCRQRNT